MATHRTWATTAEDFLPTTRDLGSLREAAEKCQGCPLYADATQTVFGEGSAKAKIVLVGEQPGDAEDRAGQPFVGPAGRLLDEMLDEAGIKRSEAYVTNAVKHFSFEQKGKRRLHKTPRRIEIIACRPWLESEIDAIEPQVVVCLGATAATSLISPSFRITRQHGEVIATDFCRHTLATFHPSAILRTPDRAAAREKREMVLHDFKVAKKLLRR